MYIKYRLEYSLNEIEADDIRKTSKIIPVQSVGVKQNCNKKSEGREKALNLATKFLKMGP